MLSTNVLCMKKRKKGSYYVSNVSDYGGTKYKNKRNTTSVMMQITEDTPPDMLAGAMDLMVHLPDGRATKMAVERSTPMMDVLVQITNANHLQISGYMLQPLAMHSSPPGYAEKVLPYLPNTPIGTLDTQDIRVVAKNRGNTIHRTSAPAQPFESTFRLKVHLPRNQLYVERVSMQAYLHDIMKKMCEEKNLDRNKYEFRHPSNLDQVLDLKLRLIDYQITEVYAVNKGSNRLTQVFSSSDSIMAFRKEDDRKQKTNSGGIFNFLKRGKVSNGSGSLSSDNRSISPTHSDDSRSVSPPVGGAKINQVDKPKPPLRKRRPAPKPPSVNLGPGETEAGGKKSDDGVGVGVQLRKKDGLTICHSRNSSDSSGYHEASILSDNANTSLPRKRPQTIHTSSNLTAMKVQSKSTSSLAFTSRLKKKAAPPPPPAIQSARSVAHLENASPVVASPAHDAGSAPEDGKQHEALNQTNMPCTRLATTVVAEPEVDSDNDEFTNRLSHRNVKATPFEDRQDETDIQPLEVTQQDKRPENETQPTRSNSVDNLNEEDYEVIFDNLLKKSMSGSVFDDLDKLDDDNEKIEDTKKLPNKPRITTDKDIEFVFSSLSEISTNSIDSHSSDPKEESTKSFKKREYLNLTELEDDDVRLAERRTYPGNYANSSWDRDCYSLPGIDENLQYVKNKPKIVGVIMKKYHDLRKTSSTGDIRKCEMDTPTTNVDLFTTLYLCSNYSLTTSADVTAKKNEEISPPESLASSLATTLSSNIETDIGNKVRNEISKECCESSEVTNKSEEMVPPVMVPLENNEQFHSTERAIVKNEEPKVIQTEETDPEVSTEIHNPETVKETPIIEEITEEIIPPPPVMDSSDWEYQLPSPPTAFRDSSPHPDTTTSEESDTTSDIHLSTDSILTSPELFEKLNVIKESQSQVSESDVRSTKSLDSEDDKFISKLSLENLEIRKKLVYNREIATSFKYQEHDIDDVASKRSSVMSELEDVLKPVNGNVEPTPVIPTTLEKNNNWNKVKAAVENFSSSKRMDRALPNFEITTYDISKKKINIYEDDSVRSSVTLPVTATYGGSVGEEVTEPEKPCVPPLRPVKQEYTKNRSMTLNRQFLQRSESFSSWTPTLSVQRSKSQVGLKPEVPKRTFGNDIGEDSRSRSTLDLTGLQSIEVMKAIRTTLTTTPATNTTSKSTPSTDEVDLSTSIKEMAKPIPPPKQITQRPVSMYAHPSINLASWKDRKPVVEKPMTPPTKMNNVTTVTNSHTTNGLSNKTPINLQSVKNNNNVSIKVNGSEPITQQSTGNVLIKIGQQQKPQDELTKRYINHSTAVGYRKPLGNINKVQNVRPNSIAIDKFEKQDLFDASRVPIVRAVELKKPHAQTNGTSVTQIRHDANKVNLFENVVLRSAASRKTAERPNSVNLSSNTDQRGQLLESIRNFGGKKGLKAVKV